MTPKELASQISDASLAALRAHPSFRAACEMAAARATGFYVTLEPTYQWITKDLGRASICLSALTLHHIGRLTMQALTAGCLANGISSAGRVQQVVRRCLDVGAMSLAGGDGLWTRRRLTLAPSLVDALRRRAEVDLSAVLLLAPQAAPAIDLLASQDGFASYVLCVVRIMAARRDLFTLSAAPPVSYFLDREAGMTLLYDLVGAQAPDRERLMQSAPISRYALSRRYGVSRAHINKLLAESGHTDVGEDGDRVSFSRELSEAMETHFAQIFELNRCAAELLCAGWRVRRRAA